MTNASRPGDKIFVWGINSPPIYILAQRSAPTRYFFQAPVFEPAYDREFLVSTEILHDLEANPPRLFVYETAPSDLVSGNRCLLPAGETLNSPELIFKWLCERYRLLAQVDEYLVFTPR
jgi:hypothetical protein